jgi:hypothetical protein
MARLSDSNEMPRNRSEGIRTVVAGVTPAQAGVQEIHNGLDSLLRGNDKVDADYTE